jgi:hypothetical protein
MVLKLYGLHASHFVRLVAAVLIEKQVPFEFVMVDLSKGEQKTPEFLAKHPFGQVPCIVCRPLLKILSLQFTRSFCCCDLVRTMTALSSMKLEPFVII